MKPWPRLHLMAFMTLLLIYVPKRQWVLPRNVKLLEIFIKLTRSLGGTHFLVLFCSSGCLKNIFFSKFYMITSCLGLLAPQGGSGGGPSGHFGLQGVSEAVFFLSGWVNLTLTSPSLDHLCLGLICNNWWSPGLDGMGWPLLDSF